METIGRMLRYQAHAEQEITMPRANNPIKQLSGKKDKTGTNGTRKRKMKKSNNY